MYLKKESALVVKVQFWKSMWKLTQTVIFLVMNTHTRLLVKTASRSGVFKTKR